MKNTINWAEFEGQTILVKQSDDAQWKPHKLVKYLESKEYPFICESDTHSESYYSWMQGMPITHIRKIDWTKVPQGTTVLVSDKSIQEAVASNRKAKFFYYSPEAHWPCWVYTNGRTAKGFKYCVLYVVAKEEWLTEEIYDLTEPFYEFESARESGSYFVKLKENTEWVIASYNAPLQAWKYGERHYSDTELFEIDEEIITKKD